jgi:SAM-dependent methyltransferase
MKARSRIALTKGWDHAMEVMSREIRSIKDTGKVLEILEAGCGQQWDLDIGDGGYVLTGIDLDAEALRIRRDETKDLHEGIVGDLRTADFGQRTFDVIFNSYVLEHVPGAQQVLENFNRWVRPGGLIIIMIPDPYSAHGFTARMTPHWFHVLFYRLILGWRNAGKPGYGPLQGHLRPGGVARRHSGVLRRERTYPCRRIRDAWQPRPEQQQPQA